MIAVFIDLNGTPKVRGKLGALDAIVVSLVLVGERENAFFGNLSSRRWWNGVAALRFATKNTRQEE
jgi:hypothetical protein